MRRTHLRKHDNILKRLLVHAGGFNLGLVMRQMLGVGKPRRLQGALSAALAAALCVYHRLSARLGVYLTQVRPPSAFSARRYASSTTIIGQDGNTTYTTGC